MVDTHLRDKFAEVGGPNAKVAVLGGCQVEGHGLIGVVRWCHHKRLNCLIMHLDDLVDLAAKVVDDVQESTLGADEHLAHFTLLRAS